MITIIICIVVVVVDFVKLCVVRMFIRLSFIKRQFVVSLWESQYYLYVIVRSFDNPVIVLLISCTFVTVLCFTCIKMKCREQT